MKLSLRVGTKAELTTKVGPGQTITIGDGPGVSQAETQATVFSTPSMIDLMEHAAREALREHLDPGEESVGIDVQITHSAATPPRSQVTAEACVTAIEKNVISFDVVARDPWGEIGRGTHRRAVIETAKFAKRLAQQKPSASVTRQTSATLPDLTTIDCRQSGHLLRITLNRPNKRNAMTAGMTEELEQIVDWLDRHSTVVPVVIVSGSAEDFSSGDDVGDLPNDLSAAGELSLRRGELYRRITTLSQVFIAAIDGLALGGGLVFAASCDYRIATHRAKFGLPEVTLGWPPNYGLGIIQSLIGRGRTVELAIGGELITARRAESIGLINRVVAPSRLETEAIRLAEHIASLPPDAVRASRQLLLPWQVSSDVQSTEAFMACLESKAARNSIKRFRH